MAVEIRQLIVKSNLVQRAAEDSREPQNVDVEQLRQAVLAECREMIEEALRQKTER